MKELKNFSLQDLMQMDHDIRAYKKDFDMVAEFIGEEKLITLLRKQKDD